VNGRGRNHLGAEDKRDEALNVINHIMSTIIDISSVLGDYMLKGWVSEVLQ
jgi:hypothetical protein